MQNEGTIDLMKDFAYPLPVRVICELLGLPEELHDRCVVLSNDISVWFGDVRRPAESARVAQQAIHELEGYFAATIRERRSTRKDDLLIPDTMRELRNDDGRWPAALEELLRYECPVQAFGRTVKSDIEIEGRHLPAGSSIGFMIGASHRDPRQFPDPDRLDVRRPHLRHLAFGGDAHVCLGITLARLEGQLSITAVTRRFPNLRLMDETPDWGSNFALRGLKTLHVQI